MINILKKLQSLMVLQKGSLQQKNKLQADTRLPLQDDVQNWGKKRKPESRANIGNTELSPEYKKRMMDKLFAKTQYRKNENGEIEFLLHRGMEPREAMVSVNRGVITGPKYYPDIPEEHTSWTPDLNVAKNFAHRYGVEKPVSAWVKAKDIKSYMPHLYGSTENYNHEHEIIVSPNHQSKVHDLPKDVNYLMEENPMFKLFSKN